MKIRVFLGAIFLMSSPVAVQALPAFYGAEGGGSLSVGGRGGVVCQVTSLADSGSGTLRACVNMSGPRTVVFRVGGTINLASELIITNPYITIAGHTAPGGGIQLNGKNTSSTLRINTHDVVVRYLKIRKGRSVSADTLGINFTTNPNALRPERIIIDHTSFFWGMDENIGIFGTSSANGRDIPNHISIQNSIVAEPLRGHPAGLLTGTNSMDNAALMINIDVHRNLFAHIGYRSPLFKTHQGRFTNNIVYHWGLFASVAGFGSFDFIGHLYKHPNPTALASNRRHEIATYIREPEGSTRCTSNDAGPAGLQSSIYAVGNSGPWHPDPNDNWEMVKRINCHAHGVRQETLPAQYRRSSPLPPAGTPITVMPVSDLQSSLLPIVGASRRLDCTGSWTSNRDAADSRVINNATNNYDPGWNAYNSDYLQFGPESETEVGGFPTISGGTPCQDTDGDGMPDEWEIMMGLDPNDPSDRNTLHSSGYTMLEMYLNGPMTTNTTITAPANVRFMQ
jgi:pectate lyase